MRDGVFFCCGISILEHLPSMDIHLVQARKSLPLKPNAAYRAFPLITLTGKRATGWFKKKKKKSWGFRTWQDNASVFVFSQQPLPLV